MASSALRTVGGSSPKITRGSMARTSLPPGFRFHPTDVELIMYYLKRKVLGKKLEPKAIAEVNIYSFSPWDLPDKSCLQNKDQEWFFFCPRERKYSSGARVKRATEKGYWKTTGKERTVVYNDRTVGSVKTLIFHMGHAPKGERTDWVIHEYRIIDEQLVAAGVQDSYVLCKLFKKSGLGPKNGAQYGAPFDEAEWDRDDDDDAIDSQCPSVSFMSCGPSCAPLVSENQSVAAIEAPEFSLIEDGRIEKQGSGPKPLDNIGGTSQIPLMDGAQSALEVHPKALDNIVSTSRVPLIEGSPPALEECPKTLDNIGSTSAHATNEAPLDMTDEELFCLLSEFTDDNTLLAGENGCPEVSNGMIGDEALQCLDGHDIFNGLRDLDNCSVMNEGRSSMLGVHTDGYPLNNWPLQDNFGFIELDDLLAPLDNSADVMGTDKLHDNFGSYHNENIQQLFSASSYMNPYDYCESQMPVLPSGSNCQLPVLPHGSNNHLPVLPSGSYNQLPVLPHGSNNHLRVLPSGSYNHLPVLPHGFNNHLPVLPHGFNNHLPVLPSEPYNQLHMVSNGSNNQLGVLPYESNNQLPVLPSGSNNQLPVLPYGSSKDTSCCDTLQMINGFYSGNNDAIHDFEFAQSQPVNGENRGRLSDQYTQRGKQICASGLLESTPSCSPIAARRCAPMFSCYGSSIHIKAEVTYGTGECTKEALSGMVEESSSFLWNHPWADVPLLLHLVDFGSRHFSCYFSVFAYRLCVCHFSGRNSRKVFCSSYLLSDMSVVFTKLLIGTHDHEMNGFFKSKNVTKYLCPTCVYSKFCARYFFYNSVANCCSFG